MAKAEGSRAEKRSSDAGKLFSRDPALPDLGFMEDKPGRKEAKKRVTHLQPQFTQLYSLSQVTMSLEQTRTSSSAMHLDLDPSLHLPQSLSFTEDRPNPPAVTPATAFSSLSLSTGPLLSKLALSFSLYNTDTGPQSCPCQLPHHPQGKAQSPQPGTSESPCPGYALFLGVLTLHIPNVFATCTSMAF